jgi:hypothetical protein
VRARGRLTDEMRRPLRRARGVGNWHASALEPRSWIKRKRIVPSSEEEAQPRDWALYPRIPDGNVVDGHPGHH